MADIMSLNIVTFLKHRIKLIWAVLKVLFIFREDSLEVNILCYIYCFFFIIFS